MNIFSVYDAKFKKYGKVLKEDFSELLNALLKTDLPDSGVVYVPTCDALENTSIKEYIEKYYFAGRPIQMGYCNGKNGILNALEYHKGNEINLSDVNIVLILGDVRDIENGKYDTSKTEAFLLPKGVAVEIYATTLHYAPCGEGGLAYRTAIILPKGTNYDKPIGIEDKTVWGTNKWLFAHPDSPEAKQGAHIGLIGENLRV